MSLPLVLKPAARREYDEAGNWYESRQPGKGAEFTEAIQAVFDRIARTPRMHGIVRQDVRKAVVTGYPYCVYYRERGGKVIVISVFHTSRNPAVWQRRV